MESFIANKENTYEGARGDGLHLSDHRKFNSIDTEDTPCLDENYASGEPKENQIYCSTSSSTFIVSPSINTTDTATNILVLNDESADQHHWIRQYGRSLIILTGILFVSIIVITTVFLH